MCRMCIHAHAHTHSHTRTRIHAHTTNTRKHTRGSLLQRGRHIPIGKRSRKDIGILDSRPVYPMQCKKTEKKHTLETFRGNQYTGTFFFFVFLMHVTLTKTLKRRFLCMPALEMWSTCQISWLCKANTSQFTNRFMLFSGHDAVFLPDN